MYKIAAIGRLETIIGFRALGIDIFPVEAREDALETLRTLACPNTKYAIIYIDETSASGITEEIGKYKDSASPAIVLIPG